MLVLRGGERVGRTATVESITVAAAARTKPHERGSLLLLSCRPLNASSSSEVAWNSVEACCVVNEFLHEYSVELIDCLFEPVILMLTHRLTLRYSNSEWESDWSDDQLLVGHFSGSSSQDTVISFLNHMSHWLQLWVIQKHNFFHFYNLCQTTKAVVSF